MKSINFVKDSGWKNAETRGSAIMRIYSPNFYLKKNKIKSEIINSSHIDNFHKTNSNFKKNEAALIWVKTNKGNPKKWKDAGYITVFDPVDSDITTFNNINENFDFVLVSCESHKLFCENHRIIKNKMLIADHLSTYNENIDLDFSFKKHKIIGLVEPIASQNFKPKKLDILDYFFHGISSKNNLDFIYKDSNKLGYFFESETGKVKGLSEAYSDIDIGLSLYDIEEESTRLTTKPSTKLSAWASFGIPAVLSHQKSYDPYVKKYPFLQELIIDSLDLEAAMSIVLKLSNDEAFWKEAKSLMLSLKEEFSMNNCKKIYYDNIFENI